MEFKEKKEEILKVCQNGDIILRSKLVGKDKDLFKSLKKIMYFDEMLEMLKEAKQTIQALRLSMSAHPSCVEGSEFADYVSLADEQEKKITDLLTN